MSDSGKGKYEWKSKLLIELDLGPKVKKQIKCLGRQHASRTTDIFFIICEIEKLVHLRI